MNVTRENIDAATAEVWALLPSAAFVAMDLEMTGIGLPHLKELISDVPAVRYRKMREVASTFKIIMATGALEEEVFGVDHIINTRGTYQAGNQSFREWGLDVRPQGFGPLNIIGALANSSNFFFYISFHSIVKL